MNGYGRRRLLATVGRSALLGGVSLVTLSNSGVGASQDDSDDWTYDTGHEYLTEPTVVEETVFVGSKHETLHAIDATTGEGVWTFPADGFIDHAVTVWDDHVYLAASTTPGEPGVFELDLASGEVERSFETPAAISCSPTTSGDFLFYATTHLGVGKFLHGIDLDDGSKHLTYETDTRLEGITMFDDVVVVQHGRIVEALDVGTGDERWTYTMDDAGFSIPTVADGTVYVRSLSGDVHAIDFEDGDEVWHEPIEYRVTGVPTVADGRVVVSTDDRRLVSLDAASGERIESFEIEGGVIEGPTVADGTLFVATGDDAIVGFDLDTGDRLHRFETPRYPTAPIVVDGVVYTTAMGGTVHAFDAKLDGSSEDTRVTLGALGHNDALALSSNDSTSGGSGSDGLPAPGLLATAGAMAGGSYLAARRRNDD